MRRIPINAKCLKGLPGADVEIGVIPSFSSPHRGFPALNGRNEPSDNCLIREYGALWLSE
jgi:hypothetical protein